MNNHEESLKKVYDSIGVLHMSSREMKWHIEKLTYYKEELFKYAKFEENDIVVISKDLSIGRDSDWQYYKEKLAVGSMGAIEEVDHYEGKFRYGVAIYNTDKGIFSIEEEYLKKETGYDD